MFEPGTLWALVRRAVVFELRLYRSLFRWVTRLRDVRGDGVEPFGYARQVTPVIWLWIFASAVEVPVVHLLVPWESVRIVLLVVSVWGLMWMVGFLASLQVYPHQLTPAGLRIRHGASVDITLPWSAIATLTSRRRDLPSSMWTLQHEETESGPHLAVAVSGQVNVLLRLREPITVPTPKGPMTVAELSFLADEPRALVDRARELRGTGTAGRTGRGPAR